MQYNASLDALYKRLLAPFPPVLTEVKRLLHVTVAEEQATELHQAALDRPAASKVMTAEPGPSAAAVHGAATPPPSRMVASPYPVPPDNAALAPAVEPSAATMRSIAPHLSPHGKPMAGSPAAPTSPASCRYPNRPTIRLAPRASATPSSRPATTPSRTATESPPVTTMMSPSPASSAGTASVPPVMSRSAGVPVGLQQDRLATGEPQTIPVSPPSSPPVLTVPVTAPTNRQGVLLAPRPAPPAAARLANGVEPVLARAARLTQAALHAAIPGPPAAPDNPRGQVHNTFNVAVSLNPAETTASLDREALQEVLVELLRTAARRQGLEV